MAGRIRSIKPETLEDDRPASLTDSAWRLWVSMWLIADDHGNCRANASYLAGQIWWAHDKKPDVEALLAELEAAGSIHRYTVRGQEYAHVERWEKHQRVDNAGKPRVPPPAESDPCDSPRVAANLGSDLRPPTTIPTADPAAAVTPDPGGRAQDSEQPTLFDVPSSAEDPQSVVRPKRSQKQGRENAEVDALLEELSEARIRVRPAARPIAPTPASRKGIAARLADGYAPDDVRHVIAVCEAECRRWRPSGRGDDRDPFQWFDAVSPFRPDNFERKLARPAPALPSNVTPIRPERRERGLPWPGYKDANDVMDEICAAAMRLPEEGTSATQSRG